MRRPIVWTGNVNRHIFPYTPSTDCVLASLTMPARLDGERFAVTVTAPQLERFYTSEGGVMRIAKGEQPVVYAGSTFNLVFWNPSVSLQPSERICAVFHEVRL